MKFKVGVEKRMYATGTVEVDCDNDLQAIRLVQDRIDTGALQTASVEWGDAEYEACSFMTTGDID